MESRADCSGVGSCRYDMSRNSVQYAEPKWKQGVE